MIKVSKKQGQSNDQVARTFKKAVRDARFVNVMKKDRYRKNEPTRLKVRSRALARERFRAIRKKEQRMAL
jgi:ribosomal protein S21